MPVERSSHVAAAKHVADATSPDSKPAPARKGVTPGNSLGHPSPLKPAAAPMASDNPYAPRPIEKKNPYSPPAPIDENDPYSAAASANEPGVAAKSSTGVISQFLGLSLFDSRK